MPHFIVECTERTIPDDQMDLVISVVHELAIESDLFNEADVKIRIRRTDNGWVGGEDQEFIHVFCHIMEGRSIEQRKTLSNSLVEGLANMFPQVSAVAANIYEFEKATYTNRKML